MPLLLILITAAYLSGRKDSKNAQQQAVDEGALSLPRLALAAAPRSATSGTEAPGDGAGDKHREPNHRQAETREAPPRAERGRREELDAIRTASRLLSGHARQFQKDRHHQARR
ncbi:hypothetical protein P4050_00580 [Pseudomonas aeruginosa]|nr:hypothetical protein [Pseudomonas aeruginosa]